MQGTKGPLRQALQLALIAESEMGKKYSGVAFSFVYKDDPEIVAVTSWPGIEGYIQPKIPTIVAYDHQNTKFTWGAQGHVGPIVENFKLLLDEEENKSQNGASNHCAAQLKSLSKSVAEVTSDYIRALYEHALSYIATKVPKECMDMCEKKFIVTVPAVWTDRAKDVTLKAAKAAGVQPARLITEPEAAALYTLNQMSNFSLKIGDAFVVCDAGGGTVDLISYEVQSLVPRLQLVELVEPSGEFHALKKKTGWEDAKRHFDRSVKPQFKGTDDELHLVSFPMAKLIDQIENGLEDSVWSLQGRDLKRFFAPVILQIEKLVEKQVNNIRIKRTFQQSKEPRAIMLVGGFGASMYLKQRLMQKFPRLEVIQPLDAWSAIVRGAVLSMMPQQATVTKSVSKKHWGVSAHCTYDATSDAGEPRWFDAFTGEDRIHKMTWYIGKGQELERDKKVSFPFYRELPRGFGKDDLIFHDRLITSESFNAPVYPTPGLTEKHCTVKSDLRALTKRQLASRKGRDGNMYYVVNYSLTLTAISAGFEFALEIKGRKLGSVETKWE
ncbi:MAG: hypothetical protein Q9159_002120 [Coniocarpon cinnabarinum]